MLLGPKENEFEGWWQQETALGGSQRTSQVSEQKNYEGEER